MPLISIGTASRVEVTMICDSTIDTLYMDPPGVSVKRLGLGHAFDPDKGLTNMPVADNCSCMSGAIITSLRRCRRI